jgi:hypothetical protein
VILGTVPKIALSKLGYKPKRKNMNKINKMVVGVFCASLLTISAINAATTMTTPSPKLRMWEATVGGVGLTAGNDIGNNWQWGGELGVSRTINVNLLFPNPIKTDLGLRQSVSYGTTADSTCQDLVVDSPCTELYDQSGCDKKDGWWLRTEIFWDWNVPIYRGLSFFVGPNIGFNYGNIAPTWTVGPEAGFRYKITQNVFMFTRVNYDVNITDSNDLFRVGAGFGFRF